MGPWEPMGEALAHGGGNQTDRQTETETADTQEIEAKRVRVREWGQS